LEDSQIRLLALYHGYLDNILTNDGCLEANDGFRKPQKLDYVPYNDHNFVKQTQNQWLSVLMERGLKNLHPRDENAEIWGLD